jgi:hypothetical protein
MKSRLRLILPAITTAMLVGAAPSLADNSANRYCPDPSAGWILVSTIVYPEAAVKDKNDDTLVCAKVTEPATKDNNNPEFTDDIILTP